MLNPDDSLFQYYTAVSLKALCFQTKNLTKTIGIFQTVFYHAPEVEIIM